MQMDAIQTGAPVRPSGKIGPNALLQLIPLLERVGGRTFRIELFASAGVFEIATDGLIDEGPVARVHQLMRARLPDLAEALAWEAGHRTADYILANRIPPPVVHLLKRLPARLAAPLLTRAITRHAWTFAGSGRFSVASRAPLTFAIAENPVVRGERADHPVCHWHAAVFDQLFRSLVHPRTCVRETACCAMGAPACRFEITWT